MSVSEQGVRCGGPANGTAQDVPLDLTFFFFFCEIFNFMCTDVLPAEMYVHNVLTKARGHWLSWN